MNATIRTSRVFKIAVCVLLLSLLIAACGTATQPPVPEEATEAPVAIVTEPPTSVPTDPPVVEPSKPLSGLAADPQRVEFQAEDGTNLIGYYYPSKYAEAPIVILMHWAGGDLTDWCKIAPWLQNRADENPVEPERCANAGAGLPDSITATWLDPTWFPPMNADASVAVFTFDFRGFGESDEDDWSSMKLDALAAFQTAAGLEGVYPGRMAALGASIGADGAPDGCLLYNQEAGSGCVGALSLSPGNYLGMDYATTVAGLAPVPVGCLAGELDVDSASTCESASGATYRSVIYPGTDLPGMTLIIPDLEPQPMILIQEFLELVFGEVVR